MQPGQAGSRYLLMGLPGTGKTTFLAALWHLVEAAEVPVALRLVKLVGDREYINELTRKWLQCEPLSRTPVGLQTWVSMHLQDVTRRSDLEIAFPDFSGEVFGHQWAERSWSLQYDELVDNASGALLLIHPETVTEPYTIQAAQMIVAAAGGETKAAAPEWDEGLPWSPDVSPTQVILTDLLQFIQQRRGSDRPLKVGVVVSAWDLVEDQEASPENWVRQRLPLLSQFLESCAESWSVRVYGLSAQGGDLERERSQLLEHHRPSERVRIVGPDASGHDLTAPLRWLSS